MANLSTYVDLVDLGDLANPYAFGFPSASDQSQGYSEVDGNIGDNLILTVYGDGSNNSGYTPSVQNYTGGSVSSVSAIGTQSPYPYTTVYVSNMTQSGYVDILCGPASSFDTSISNGWRASMYVYLLDTDITLQYSTVNLYSGNTYYQQRVSGAGSSTIYYAMNTPSISDGTDINDYFTSLSSAYVARTFDTSTTLRVFSSSGTGATITRDLPTVGSTSSSSKTFYIYAANSSGERSQYTGTTYTVNLIARAPTVSASKAIIPNGFGMYSNPTGTTSGTIEYQWTTTGGGNGPNKNVNNSYGWNTSGNLSQNAGVGTEWVGTTWSVQARATVNGGASYVYSNPSSVTLPEYTVTAPTSVEEGEESTNFSVNSTNTLGPVYWQVTPTGEFSTSSGSLALSGQSGGVFKVTPIDTDALEGTESATVKLYINNTFNNSNYVYATDTFNITEVAQQVTAPTVNSGTWTDFDINGNETKYVGVTIAWSGGQNGTLQLAVTTTNTAPSTGWVTDTDQTSPGLMYYDSNGNQLVRGTTYYLWARRSSTAVSSSISSTAPYLLFDDNTITLGNTTDKNGNILSTNASGAYVIPNTYGTTSADYIRLAYSNGGSNLQYRMRSSDASQTWVATGAAVGGSSYFQLTPANDLPTAGNTFTYYFQGRRPVSRGGTGSWASVTSTPSTYKIFRTAASSYSVSPSSTSINEGQSVTFTVTTTDVANNTEVDYTISGISSDDLSAGSLTGTLTIANNTAFTSITLKNDVLTEGSETATFTLDPTDSANAATGSASASVTIADTSTQPGGGSSTGLSGGTANAYGLAIKNQAGTQTILDDTSRIGTILTSGSITFTDSYTSDTLFTGFNCSNVATTGFIIKWTGTVWYTPTITRSSNGITVSRIAGANGTATIYLIRY